ncbi:MYCBP-associated protein-like [Mizuhopecten yessoensis]|uniref:MYCBP-associated protein n=1 Tax=Mizuhopecten yessoensis TaxID=6573 RepID=A0A210PXY5_MIZYE|nr:MYCBP-associated protein-like [Mizuhopecten yessoensis]OWF41358.1 MYCBP-associated protein [Mizuhopecten yessoensis]
MESKTSIGNKNTKAGKGAFKNKKSLMPQASAKITKKVSSTAQTTGSVPNAEKKRKEPKPKIWDEELKKTVIQPIDFLMLRAEMLMERQRKGEWLNDDTEEKTIVVRKLNPETPEKTVMVLKPAPSSAEIQYSKDINYAGPRFNDKGKFIPHSILGGLQDFKKMALQRGEFQHLFTSQRSTKKKKTPQVEDYCSPLKTWKFHLKDWNHLRNHLSSSVSRPVENLLMNTPDFYPRPILDRHHVHAAMETMYSSHGEDRKASRFWRQRVPSLRGDDLTRIHATLNQSEEGKFMASEQFVDVPNNVKQEKGGIIRSYPAYYTHCLEEQESAVSDVIRILNPHHPLMEELSITGKNQEKISTALSGGDGPNVSGEVTLIETVSKTLQEENFKKSVTLSPAVQQPILNKWEGPAVMIGSQVFKWAGSHRDQQEQTAGIASVLFEGEIGKNILSYLEIYNVGSTVIHYEWTKNEKKKGLENLPSFQNTKFYFLTEGGVMAPGEILKLPILFKGSISGIFSESWKLMTRPLLCGGADIVLNLKSVITVTRPDQEIDKVEKCLNHRNALTIATKIIEDIFRGVKTPMSPLSPKLAYISEEDNFQQRFPGMIYHSGKAKEMEALYNTILTSIPGEFQHQECTCLAVKQALGKLMNLDPTNEKDGDKCLEEARHKYSCLATFHHLCSSLLISWPTPVYNQRWERYKIGLVSLQGAVDKFVDMTFRTAKRLGLPLRVEEGALDKAAKKAPPKKSIATKPKKKDNEKAVSPSLMPGGQSKDERIKSSASSKGRPKTCSPESNPDPGEKAPDSFIPVLTSKVSKTKMDTYRERVHLQAYHILESAIEQMFLLFDD